MLIKRIESILNKVFLLVIFMGPLPNVLYAQVNTNEGSSHLGMASKKEIIGAMTLEEKALILVGAGLNSQAPVTEDGMIGDVKGKVQGAAGSTNSLLEYGIPEVILADGPAGLRIDPVRDGDSINYLLCNRMASWHFAWFIMGYKPNKISFNHPWKRS